LRVDGADGEWTPGDVAGRIGNPFYAVNIDPHLAVAHDPIVSEEEWVAANTILINELGQNIIYVTFWQFSRAYPRGR